MINYWQSVYCSIQYTVIWRGYENEFVLSCVSESGGPLLRFGPEIPSLGLLDSRVRAASGAIKVSRSRCAWVVCKVNLAVRYAQVERLFSSDLQRDEGLDYRELEYAQRTPAFVSSLSAWCVTATRLAFRYSAEIYFKDKWRQPATDIGIIEQDSYQRRIEDIKQLRQDSTVVETNIHYPTNNLLVWDCWSGRRRGKIWITGIIQRCEKNIQD